jgi:hypothetical protein
MTKKEDQIKPIEALLSHSLGTYQITKASIGNLDLRGSKVWSDAQPPLRLLTIPTAGRLTEESARADERDGGGRTKREPAVAESARGGIEH